MKRRGFLGVISGVVFGGLFKWSFPTGLLEPIFEVDPEGNEVVSRVVYWAGIDGDWDYPANWVGGSMPRNGDSVVITGGRVRGWPTEPIEIKTMTILDGTVDFTKVGQAGPILKVQA